MTGSYTDPYSGVQDTYNIDRPTDVAVSVKVSVDEAISDEVKQQIKDAIMADYNGETDDESIRIGSSVYASRFYADIARLSINGLALVSVKVSDDNGSTWNDILTFDMNELPVIEGSTITFEVV